MFDSPWWVETNRTCPVARSKLTDCAVDPSGRTRSEATTDACRKATRAYTGFPVTRDAHGNKAMFIMLSMIVSPLVAFVGIVPARAFVRSKATSSPAAARTLRFNRAHSATRPAGTRREHSARHAASDDSPYMNPTSWVGLRSCPK